MRLKEPVEVALAFAEAWNDRDPDALADLFVEDADFVNVVGLWWEDRRNIRRAHARGFRVMFGSSEMALERTKVRLLGSDSAVVLALWRMTGQLPRRGAGGRPGWGVHLRGRAAAAGLPFPRRTPTGSTGLRRWSPRAGR